MSKSAFIVEGRYRLAAEQGKADAQYNYGRMCEQGDGAQQDYQEAAEWYQRAAEQGHVNAQLALGSLYEQGHGIAQNDVEAVKWYRKAADQGDASAQYSLGVMLAFGQGIAADGKEALLWCLKAAKQNHIDAQQTLGMMYANGEAVNVDYQQSVYWFEKSAQQGFAPAQYRLGEMVWFGIGSLTQNKRRAAGLFRAAAEQDDPDAQMNLAMLLGSGDGLAWSYDEALDWMKRAYNNGHDTAQEFNDLLSHSEDRRFSPEVQAGYWRQQKNYWIEMAAAFGVREAEEKVKP